MAPPIYAALGFLFAGARRGANIHFAAAGWVALAVDRDDPIRVTILHDVEDRADLDRDVELVGSADEVYELSMQRTAAGYRLDFHLQGAEVSFTCRTVTTGTRYFTQSELDELCARPWTTSEGADRYLRGIADRTHLVATDVFSYQIESPLPF